MSRAPCLRRLILKSIVQRTTRINAISQEYDKMPSLAASFALKGEGQNLHFSDISQGFFARFISVELCIEGKVDLAAPRCLEPRFLRTHGAPCRTAGYDPKPPFFRSRYRSAMGTGFVRTGWA